MKAILMLVSIVFSAQAFATATDVRPGVIVEPSEGTKVLEVTFRTVSTVNCPGSLDLKVTNWPTMLLKLES